MTPTTAVRPDSHNAWTFTGNAQDTLTLNTRGRNWINAIVASGHSATASVSMLIDGQAVATITLRAGSTWSPAFATPQPLPPNAVIQISSNEIAHVSVFGFSG